jgi:hypothetical protein
VLLDICYRELTKKEKEHLYDLPKEHPLIVKITEVLKGQRYPSDGPIMTQGERIKNERMFRDYSGLKMDLSYTNELLGCLAKRQFIEALIWGRVIYDRF